MTPEEDLFDRLKYNVVIKDDGTRLYFDEYGSLHRDDGPAKILPSGVMHWLRHGVLHRTDGPAVFDPQSLAEEYWVNGELHRTDGPAIIFANGEEHWYQNGKLHREDGPAITFASGVCFWYLDGIHYTKTEHRRKLRDTL